MAHVESAEVSVHGQAIQAEAKDAILTSVIIFTYFILT